MIKPIIYAIGTNYFQVLDILSNEGRTQNSQSMQRLYWTKRSLAFCPKAVGA
jgi:hypothetical protein